MDITQEQQEKIAKLKLIGLALKIEYEKAKAQYEEAKTIEEQAEQTALDIYNKKHNTNYEDSCDFVNSKKDFGEWLKYRQEEFSKLGIEIEIDKTYSNHFLRAEFKAEKSYLKIATTFLRLFGKDEEANEIDKTIDTYIPEKFKTQLLALNDKFLGL